MLTIIQVYELFCYLRPLFDNYPEHQPCELHPHAPHHVYPDMHPHHHTQWVDEEEEIDDREASVDKMGEMERVGPGVEFYPVDPLSRGMVDRLRELNMSLSNMVYMPYEDMSGSQYLKNTQSSEKLEVGFFTIVQLGPRSKQSPCLKFWTKDDH